MGDIALFGMPDRTEDPTQHELESRAAIAGWKKIRKHLIDVVTEDAAMPVGQEYVSHSTVVLCI